MTPKKKTPKTLKTIETIVSTNITVCNTILTYEDTKKETWSA